MRQSKLHNYGATSHLTLPGFRRTPGSDLHPALAPAPVREGDLEIDPAAIRSVTAAAVAVRQPDVSLEASREAVYLYFAGLMQICPRNGKRDCLTFGHELERLF